ncbi:MAG: SRPBCC family protein [Candidatus Bathyarchaeia archaeon]
MPSAETKVTINASLFKIWAFLNNLENIGKCLGVVDEVKLVNKNRARWILKSQQARVTRTKEVEAQFTMLEENKRIAWSAKGENLSIEGECELEPKGNSTECKIKLTFEVLGVLGSILKPMISMTIKSRLEAFTQCIKENVEKM